MAPLRNAATFTLKDAAGNPVEFRGTFTFTGADATGYVTGAFTPVTAALDIPIPLAGKVRIDGSISFDLAGTTAAGLQLALGLPPADAATLSSASLLVADPLAKEQLVDLYKAVKAEKKATREYRLSLQAEEAAKVDADTTSTNRGVLNRAIQLLADMQDVLDSGITSDKKITRIGELKTVLPGLSLQVGATVITDLVTALNSDSNTEAEKLNSFRSAVTQATTDLATAKTSAESRDVAAQARKVAAVQKVPVAKKVKNTATKAVTKANVTLIKKLVLDA
jgi:hypothetical protein